MVDADGSCMVGPCVNFGIPSMIRMVRNAHGRLGMYYHWAKLAKSDRQDAAERPVYVGEPTCPDIWTSMAQEYTEPLDLYFFKGRREGSAL
jgi:hypothetical protein